MHAASHAPGRPPTGTQAAADSSTSSHVPFMCAHTPWGCHSSRQASGCTDIRCVGPHCVPPQTKEEFVAIMDGLGLE